MDDLFPDEPRLTWDMLTENERLCAAVQLPTEFQDWEMYAGLYVRIDPDTVVYVEPLEIH